MKIGGNIIGLIGQNGAGKTTLVNLILGLLKPEKGKISIDNQDVILQRNSILKKIGAVFEDSDFPPWVNLIDYLKFVGEIRGLDIQSAEREANQLLDKFNLTDYKRKTFHKLSAGMKQKFGIAQALIGSPKYVFLDEPTANLDIRARLDILEYLQELVREGEMTIIILSHILHDLERICDKIIFIHNGKLILQAEMAELLKQNFLREYTVRLKSIGEMEEICLKLNRIGITEINAKGIVLKFRSYENELNKIKEILGDEITITPTRGLLEQIFVDEVGVRGH